MPKLLSESEQIAAKDYDCQACEWLLNRGVNGYGHSIAELRIIAKAKKYNYKIKKGEKYLRQRLIFEGQFYTFVARPEIHKICLEHEIYEH